MFICAAIVVVDIVDIVDIGARSLTNLEGSDPRYASFCTTNSILAYTASDAMKGLFGLLLARDSSSRPTAAEVRTSVEAIWIPVGLVDKVLDNVADVFRAHDESWVDDSEAPNCMRCSKTFTFFVRRHHCRECGYVICKECSGGTSGKQRKCVSCKETSAGL